MRLWRREGPRLRYYLYVSDAKLDMLFEQIDHRLLKRLSAEVKVDLKLAGITLRRAENPAPARMAKLRVVERFLDRHHSVGKAEEPGAEYVRGSMPMTWGWLRWRGDVDEDGVPRRDMVLFQGQQDDYTVALAGSGRHVLAWNGIGKGTGFSLTSVTADILWALDQHLAHAPELADLLRENKLVRHETAPEHTDDSNVLLGTPLYIALASEPPPTASLIARGRNGHERTDEQGDGPELSRSRLASTEPPAASATTSGHSEKHSGRQ